MKKSKILLSFADFVRELKIMACRVCMKLSFVIFALLLYLIFWVACDACIFWLAAVTCSVSLLGAPFMSPACAAGVGALLLKGIHMGSGPLRMDVQWDA